jgi:hypothetical protein
MLRILSILLIAASISANAQITITSADMPSAGSSYVISTAGVFDGFDFTETGSGYTWNYSTMSSTGQNTRTYSNISSAPFTYQFLFNNPFDQAHLASYTIQTEGFSVAQVSFENFYEFYKNSSADFRIVGYGATVNSLPVPAQTNPTDVVYDFPMDMGSTNESYSEWPISIPTLGSYLLKQTRSYEVDGYGTLVLPNGTYECLRLKMDIAANDSLYVDALGFGFSLPRNSTEYHWLAAGQGVPVLKAVYNLGFASQVTYLDTPINVTEITTPAFQVFPTAANEFIQVTNSLNQQMDARIFSISGELVLSETNVRVLNTAHLTNGMYVVELSTAGHLHRQQIVIAH